MKISDNKNSPEASQSTSPAIAKTDSPSIARPQIVDYESPVEFIRDMLHFRKQSEPGFSVQMATRALRRVSPALVSLILSRKRKLTLDRVDEFAKLLNLNSGERFYLRSWIMRNEPNQKVATGPIAHLTPLNAPAPGSGRKDVSTHILNDWLNIYVKDLFQFPLVQQTPSRLDSLLSAIAKPGRIRKSLEFLLREGHLRRKLNGEITLDTQLAVADAQISSQKIRRFHKNALTIAKDAIDLYGPTERLSNTLVIPLSDDDHQELLELTKEFAEKLKQFAESRTQTPERLYQFIVNLSPIGGKIQ